MQLHAYLNYGGNCEEAFRFYEKNLGGEILMIMLYAEREVFMPIAETFFCISVCHVAGSVRKVVDDSSDACERMSEVCGPGRPEANSSLWKWTGDGLGSNR